MAAKAITFVVPGQDEAQLRGTTRGAAGPALPPGFRRGHVTHAVRVRSQRAAGGDVRVSAVPGLDAVVLHLANGPSLILHPESARDLLLAQSAADTSRGAGAAPAQADEVAVPTQLGWRRLEQAAATRGATRGLGDVLLSLVEVIRGPAADLAAEQVVKHVDDQVDEAVYALGAEGLEALKGRDPLERIPASNGTPILVFIHGTFSSTKGTFDKLWTQHPQRVRKLFEHYGNRVYALDHRTLGASPIANALTLARALPRGAPVHLVTHSRGGLVAEVLARACGNRALSPEELKPFAGGAYDEQRRDLASLVRQLKDVQVGRIVRVACPARGTLLASKRLDAYLSVFKWALELAGLPVSAALVDFLAEVAQRRTDPLRIPGLAAQVPESPLVQWLHAPAERIAGELRVVAGDIAGDSVVSWLKTLLSDSFYRTDNDLVVQTSSMYGGAPRRDEASFVFDQGGKVSHFSYFGNERTAEAVVDALVKDAPPGFRTIGPLSWSGKSESGYRAAPGDTGPAGAKPAVFVLPGILGSNLKTREDERIWLAFRVLFGLKRLEYKPGGRDGILTDGPVGMVYDGLVDFLSESHEVIEFPFDWRRPIEEEARRLANAVEGALDARAATNKPVRLVAHSMGGLVARAMQLDKPDLWKRMMAVEGARVLMLGTPNGGSWAPMQTLSGDDAFGNLLVSFGAPFQELQMRRLMARMPGFIQLQAKLTDPQLALDKAETWQALADRDREAARRYSLWHNDGVQLAESIWGVPTQDVLDQAVALRKRLDAQAAAGELVPAGSKVLLVVGKAPFTPDGFAIAEDGLSYLEAQEAGDGRVTLTSALLPGVRAWVLDCEHGKLPSEGRAFKAYLDLLERGSTQELPALETQGAAGGAAAAHVRSRRSRVPALARPPETPRDVLDASDRGPREAVQAAGAALEITVVNGNLAFVQPPLLIGHYRSELLTGTEWVMDSLVGGTMQDSLKLGRYPSAPGTQQVFLNTRAHPDDVQRLPRPTAVIVVGLGEEGELRGSELAETVRQGVIAWAQQVAQVPDNMPPQFKLAATLIGSGGPGISAGQAAQLVAQGVREANVRLLQLGGKWPSVGQLELIELYLDRAAEALRALQIQALASPAFFRVAPTVKPGPGGLRRPLDLGYRGTSYDYISAITHREHGKEDVIQYTLDTRRARTEVRSQQAQGSLLRELVKASTREAIQNTRIGQTLFRLLVPLDLAPFLGGTMEMVIELDRNTAGIPWELLDAPPNGGGDPRPWAIRAKLVRKLRTAEFRPQVTDAGKNAGVLIVGEPECKQPTYPRLPGARREANAVLKRLTAPGALRPERVKGLIAPEDPSASGATGPQVIEALVTGNWRVVHISGHGEEPRKIGEPPKKPDDPPQKYAPARGVVLSDDIFLGPAEVRAMPRAPELVFVNCCHLAASDPEGVMNYSRPFFAATVAEELIQVGVRCVVAAGWAVDDTAAEVFATTFYDALLRGERFMDAVAQAREAARAQGGNTWAAYQCYGDPNWRLQLAGGDAQVPAPSPGQELAGVTSADALVLALQTIATNSQSAMPKPNLEAQRARIRYLQSVNEGRWGGKGDVAEAFGEAWKHAGDAQKAIEWYGRAVMASDGRASMRAAEQLHNLRVRAAAQNVAAARDRRKLRTTARAAAREAREAATALEKLAAAQPSMERADLCGSAYKRLAMILDAAGQSDRSALAAMRRHYAEAEKIGQKERSPDVFYPALNRIAAEVVLRPAGRSAAAFTPVRAAIAAKLRDQPEFWSAAGDVELTVYEALAEGKLARSLPAIERAFDDLHERWAANWMWASVRDQARFVLPRYARQRVSAAEKKAAAALLARLEGY